MNSYIEVTWLLMTGIHYFSHWCTHGMLSLPYHHGRLILISMINALILCFVYSSEISVFLVEVLFGLKVYSSLIPAFLQKELWMLFFLTFLKVTLQGGLVHGVLFVADSSISWLFWLAGISLFLSCFIPFMKHCIARKSIRKKLVIEIQDKQIVMNGYLDSGNTLQHEKIPVIFLAQRYASCFQGITGTFIEYSTVSGTAFCTGYPCMIQIEGCHKKVYAAISPQLNSAMDCLLNIKLFV